MKEKIIWISSVLLLIFFMCFSVAADKKAQFKQKMIQKQFIYQQKEQKIYLGDYRVTFYCSCSSCCGQWTGGPTASGVMPTANHTAACGEQIPFGTVLYVQGLGYYTCEDRGVGNECIDIYVNDHSEIPSWGLDYIATYRVQ